MGSALFGYTLTYVPDGYELVEERLDLLTVRYVFANNYDRYMIFEQVPISNNQYTIDAEHGFTDVVTYGQFTVYCRIIDNTGYYVWNNNKYAFSLYCDTIISEDELKKIIEGIETKIK